MQAIRRLYGTESLDLTDLADTNINHLIELSYYKTKKANQYEIEIVKTEHLENALNVESESMNIFTDNETKANHVLDKLKRNKVTPIGLKDTIIDIIKQEII